MKQFLGYIIKKAVGKGKVSPTIKSVKPNLKKTVKETKRDLETKNFLKIDKLRKQKSEGMKAARKAQRELQRAAETKRATKIGSQYYARSVPARGADLKNPTEVKTKKFKTGKELEREKKMGGGMMGRRFGYRKGTPKPKNLKPVDKKKNPGLAKLPTEVRNRMGYMKSGGRAGFNKGGGADAGKKDFKKKDFKLGLKFQGDYKGKSFPGKVKEFVKTGVKQTIGTAKKFGKKK